MNREAIFKTRTVVRTLPSGDKATFRIMTGAEREAWRGLAKDADLSADAWYAELVIRTLATDAGELMFTAAERDQIIADTPVLTLEELFQESLLANGIGKKANAEAKKD